MAGLLCIIVMAVMVKMELGLLLFNSLSLLIFCYFKEVISFKAFLFVCLCVRACMHECMCVSVLTYRMWVHC
jgi:hypothetical protein